MLVLSISCFETAVNLLLAFYILGFSTEMSRIFMSHRWFTEETEIADRSAFIVDIQCALKCGDIE